MKKVLLLLFVALLTMFSATAQPNALEAKASYLLAEESYGKGDMRAALDYLDEATSKLGAANAKILYLKIMVLKELSAKNANYDAKLDAAIAEFEKSPDAADFNEDKAVEIVKIKMERKRLKAAGSKVDQALRDYEAKVGWIIGMHADSMKRRRPDLFADQPGKYFFYTTGFSKGMYGIYHYKEKDLKGLLSMIIVKDSIVLNYTRNLFNYSQETGDYEKSRQVEEEILEELKDLFGYVPEPTVKTTDYDKSAGGGALVNYSYVWEGKALKMSFQISRYNPDGKKGSSGTLTLYK